MKTYFVALSVAALLLLLPFVTHGAAGEPGANDKETGAAIENLIQCIQTSGFTFIRNGTPHSASEAAAHIRMKYGYVKSRIKTPEDFISYCGTGSSITGESYQVETPNGRMRVDKWLIGKLREFRG